jgi:hypothetical protein
MRTSAGSRVEGIGAASGAAAAVRRAARRRQIPAGAVIPAAREPSPD